jgi:hypothetical protein
VIADELEMTRFTVFDRRRFLSLRFRSGSELALVPFTGSFSAAGLHL